MSETLDVAVVMAKEYLNAKNQGKEPKAFYLGSNMLDVLRFQATRDRNILFVNNDGKYNFRGTEIFLDKENPDAIRIG